MGNLNSRNERTGQYQEVNLHINNACNNEKSREEFSPFRLLTCAKVMLEDGKKQRLCLHVFLLS